MVGKQTNRRQFLRWTSIAVAAGLAGCTDESGDVVVGTTAGTTAGTTTGATTTGETTATDPATSTNAPTESETETPTRTATTSVEEAPLDRQLAMVREATKKYRGSDGIDRAFADGYTPTPTGSKDWTFVPSAPDEEIDLRNPTSLTYVRQDGDLRLGAVGYGLPHSSDGPPDLFNDEGEDVRTPEADGWFEATNTIWATFSNGDEEVDDVATLPRTEVFDRTNWKWTPTDPGGRGDRFDVDGDGTAETLDFVYERGPLWGLHVWVHIDNPCGVFDFAYSDDVCGTR